MDVTVTLALAAALSLFVAVVVGFLGRADAQVAATMLRVAVVGHALAGVGGPGRDLAERLGRSPAVAGKKRLPGQPVLERRPRPGQRPQVGRPGRQPVANDSEHVDRKRMSVSQGCLPGGLFGYRS